MRPFVGRECEGINQTSVDHVGQRRLYGVQLFSKTVDLDHLDSSAVLIVAAQDAFNSHIRGVAMVIIS